MTLRYPRSYVVFNFKVTGYRVMVKCIAIRRGFELYVCLLVIIGLDIVWLLCAIYILRMSEPRGPIKSTLVNTNNHKDCTRVIHSTLMMITTRVVWYL